MLHSFWSFVKRHETAGVVLTAVLLIPALVLGVLWARDPEGNYEPYTFILGVLGTLVGSLTTIAHQMQPDAPPSSVAKPLANTTTVARSESRVSGATQSGRQPFFIGEPFDKLAPALIEARQRSVPVFLVTYDPRHPTKSKLQYSLGCFLDYFATKQLVEDHFVTALVPATDPDVAALVPEDDPLENSLWIVLSPEKEVLRREGVYANADEGLKRVRQVIAQTSSA